MNYSFTGYLYGKHVFTEQLEFDEDTIARYRRSVLNGLERVGWTEADLPGKRVMDVGTGGYGLAFAELGAHVTLCDLNWSAVERAAAYARERGLDHFEAECLDLLSAPLPSESFDLIYLSGVFQHLRDPRAGIARLAGALRPGGALYIDFYRSGRWRWFVTDLIRRIVRPRDLHALERALGYAFGFGMGDVARLEVGGERSAEFLLDDLFVEHANLFAPDQVHDAAQACGLKRIYGPTSKDLPDRGGAYDHDLEVDHIFNTFVFSREQAPDTAFSRDLAPALQPTDQLGGIAYTRDEERRTIELALELVGAVEAGRFADWERVQIALALYRTVSPFVPRDPYFPEHGLYLDSHGHVVEARSEDPLGIRRHRKLSRLLEAFLL